MAGPQLDRCVVVSALGSASGCLHPDGSLPGPEIITINLFDQEQDLSIVASFFSYQKQSLNPFGLFYTYSSEDAAAGTTTGNHVIWW